MGFGFGNVYSSGLSKSYGSGLSSGYAGYSFSSGYTPSYATGYSTYLARSAGNYYSGQTTPSTYKRSYEPSDGNGSTQSSSSNNWRSKSIEGNGYRDTRSMSRDGYSAREHSITRDLYQPSSDSYRGPSVGRDRFKDYSSRDFTPSREFTPSRDFSRRGSSVGTDALPLPPPRMKKYGFHKSASNLPNYDATSRYNNATASG